MATFEGFIVSRGPGRKDTITLWLSAGDYILPSDIVAACGDGNSLAGAKWLDDFFMLETSHLQKPELACVIVAGGEYVVRYDRLVAKFHGTLEEAAERCDVWVLEQRRAHIATLIDLPPPKGGYIECLT